MPSELTVLVLGALLLLVHVFVAVRYKTRQYGTNWNVGARDEDLPPLNPVAGRLERASQNFRETFPVAIVAFLGVIVAGKQSDLTAIAAWTWLGARVIYLPLYWAGIPVVRTAIWGLSMLALLGAIAVLLVG